MSNAVVELDGLLEAARAGQTCALGHVLQSCRGYLLAIADREFDSQLGGKAGASDLVQETFLEAQRDFSGFRGTTEAELLAWLRRLLLNNLSNFSRGFYACDKRRLSRELPLDDIDIAGGTAEPSPSQCAMRAEETDALLQALARLSEEDRRLIERRYREELSFNQIAERMGCSAKIVRRLWGEAVERLQRELDVIQ
jgi:RNA polymerase sigma-70 factor, ECF subfamily